MLRRLLCLIGLHRWPKLWRGEWLHQCDPPRWYWDKHCLEDGCDGWKKFSGDFVDKDPPWEQQDTSDPGYPGNWS